MKSMLREVIHGEITYPSLMFVCPGCAEFGNTATGLHMLPVNTDKKKPSWTWDGNLIIPTVNPSILTRWKGKNEDKSKVVELTCHSYLHVGIFEYLDDCTHSLKGQKIEIPDLPDWIIRR